MATFFHGAPEIQSDSLQTLYLMNPGYVGYPETPAPANMVLLNSTINSINPMGLSQAQQPQHLVGVPLQTTDAGRQPSSSNVSAIQGLVPRLHYNLWAQASPPTNRASTTQQGLSLSLSPHQAPYQYQRSETEVQAPVVPDITPASADDARGASVTTASVLLASNGMSGLQSVLMGSKYLKVAQQLLDEVASVGKGARDEAAAAGAGGSSKSPMKSSRDPEGSGEGEMSNKRGADLTTAERQELQMKKAKLVSMLDEVEQRYRQYHHQMQIVVSSFEAVAGPGSARTYTALALQTISRQFRCLRDAISGQVRATSKSLGEDDSLAGSKSEGGSRLRFVDHQLRQQRALQQLGMMQHNAWRPQRGLPERSVSILRAWLFEHFLHPYPKDSDKLMLAKQTGLTRSQVSNWFINARVRIWKPMVEEMYLEETKEHEQSNVDEKASKSEANENSASKSTTRQDDSPTITDQAESIKTNRDKLHDHLNPQNPPPIMVHPSAVLGIARNPASYHDRDAFLQPKLKNARTSAEFLDAELKSNQELLAKLGDARPISGDHGYALFAGGTSHAGGFGAYQVGEFGRFDAEQFTPRFAGNGGVALTLGLPHCDNLTLSGAQPTYLSSESVSLGRRLEMSTEASDYCNLNGSSNNQAMAHPSNAYERIDIHQSRKRFAARLLPDFVA